MIGDTPSVSSRHDKGIPPLWAVIIRRGLTGQNVRRFYGA